MSTSRVEKRREEKRRDPATPDARSQSLLELQVYLKARTGKGQAFHPSYRRRLEQWLEKHDVSVLIGCLTGSPPFVLCEYAFAAWENIEGPEDEVRYRERYWIEQGVKHREVLDAMPRAEEPKRQKWTPEAELARIIEETGLPNGPQARAFRKKWGMRREGP